MALKSQSEKPDNHPFVSNIRCKQEEKRVGKFLLGGEIKFLLGYFRLQGYRKLTYG